jgi:beta-galactosidase
VRPQENGNRGEVRWLSLTDPDGRGWRVDAPAGNPLSVSAWPWTMEEMARTTHASDLKAGNSITVNLDHIQMGVGGDNAWGHPVNEPYRIPARGTRSWSLVLKPVHPSGKNGAPSPPQEAKPGADPQPHSTP